MQTKQHQTSLLSRLYNRFNSSGSARKTGFTLVELLIVIVVGLIITAGVVSILWIYVFDFEQTDDITAARQRGEMVLSILEGPILHAGLGMPNGSPDFADSFSGISLDQDEAIVPVSGDSGDILEVCYSIPSSRVTTDSLDISSGDVTVNIDDKLDSQYVDNTGSTFKRWLVFPTAQVPLQIKSGSVTSTTTLTLTVISSGSGSISKFDEVHYVRAMKAGVKDESGKKVFYTDDLTMGTGEQSRVDGVEQIYFVNEDGVLSVYVLTRGNKQNVDLADDRDIPGWDESKLPSIDSSSKKYRLSVTKGSWRIRN